MWVPVPGSQDSRFGELSRAGAHTTHAFAPRTQWNQFSAKRPMAGRCELTLLLTRPNTEHKKYQLEGYRRFCSWEKWAKNISPCCTRLFPDIFEANPHPCELQHLAWKGSSELSAFPGFVRPGTLNADIPGRDFKSLHLCGNFLMFESDRSLPFGISLTAD